MPMGKGLHPAYRDTPPKKSPSASDFERLAVANEIKNFGPTKSAAGRYGAPDSMEDAQNKILARDKGDDRVRAERTKTANVLGSIASMKKDGPIKTPVKTKIERQQF